jgi:hypothetical protein
MEASASPVPALLDKVRGALGDGSFVRLNLKGYKGPEDALQTLKCRLVSRRHTEQTLLLHDIKADSAGGK